MQVSGIAGRRPSLRLGLIGLGRAAVSMLPSIMSHPQILITAAADIQEDARNRFARDFHVPTYGHAEELCADPTVDAVYISTPHQCHAPQAIVAAENHKHVLVEKPMALTLEDCEAIRTAAQRNGVRVVVGHTHSFDRPIRKMREIIASGTLGRLAMINTWNFTSFLFRPRRPEELDTSRGGGIIFNQVPHQIDMVRFLAGGLVSSVRSMVWTLDPTRPTEGSHATYLEFANGSAATIVYSGYDFFDTDEFHFWIGEDGEPKTPNGHGSTRGALEGMATDAELKMKLRGGYQQRPLPTARSEWCHPHFGILVASCEKGDLRVGKNGVLIYDENGMREVPVSPGAAHPDKETVVDELYRAVVDGRRPTHDAAWGEATLEVCLAMLRSAAERREIPLSRQVLMRDA